MTAVMAYQLAEEGKSGVILCAREFMNSLEDSSMEEIKQAIRSVPWLNAYFEMGERFIRTKNKRITYIFCGLRHNLDSIKSKARILIAWVDEAEGVSEVAWQKLLPTVREEGSQLFISWNPEREGSATDLRFRQNPPEDWIGVEMNFSDNPWFPEVLEQERLSDRDRLDDQTYAWIWEGAYRENSDAQVLSGKYRVTEFEPGAEWGGPYFGIDWGFSQDPTAGVKVWTHDSRLWIEHEGGRVGLENDDIAAYMIQRLPGIEKYKVRADSARPETISHVKSKGQDGKRANLPLLEPVDKWPGSVEDGISHLRSYKEIIIHPRCTKVLDEARKYSYKVDRATGDVLPDIIDKNNHYIDACIEHDQLVSTARGLIPVQDVVVGDMVYTRKGLRKVLVSKMTMESAQIYELKTASGLVLRATGSHRVYVKGKGFLRLDALRYNDYIVMQEPSLWQKLKQWNTAVFCGADTQSLSESQTGNTSSEQWKMGDPSFYTAMFMRLSAALSLMVGMFTTKMKTGKTIQSKTLSACRQKITEQSMSHGEVTESECCPIWSESGHSRKPGTLRLKVWQSIERLARNLGMGLSVSGCAASNAVSNSLPKPLEAETSSVVMHVSQHGGVQKVLITSPSHASGAENCSRRTNTPRLDFVADRVLTVAATNDYSPVYDLMVEDAEEFFASGVLVHNCRYALGGLIKRKAAVGILLRR